MANTIVTAGGRIDPVEVAAHIDEARRDRRPVPTMSRIFPAITTDLALAALEHRMGRLLGGDAPLIYKVSRIRLPDGAGLSPPGVGIIDPAMLLPSETTMSRSTPYSHAFEAELAMVVDHQGEITGYAAAIEIPEMTMDMKERVSFQDAVANNMFAHSAIIGSLDLALNRADVADLVVSVAIDDAREKPVRLGDTDAWHYAAEMISQIRRNCWPIHDGTMLLTGSLARPHPVKSSTHFVADFGALGSLAIQCE